MDINYNKHIVNKPTIEQKSKEHYDFIKKQFDASYLSYKDFIERKDLFVVIIRNTNGVIIGMCLVRETNIEKRKPIFINKKPTTEKELSQDNVDEKPESKKTTEENLKTTQQKINFEIIKFKIYRVVFTLVDEDYRGQGRNQELLDFVYDYAKKQNDVRYIIANIRESNTPSLKSFEKNGYKISKIKSKPYKNGEKKIRVVKFIKKNK